jgi:hypothetical protein
MSRSVTPQAAVAGLTALLAAACLSVSQARAADGVTAAYLMSQCQAEVQAASAASKAAYPYMIDAASKYATGNANERAGKSLDYYQQVLAIDSKFVRDSEAAQNPPLVKTSMVADAKMLACFDNAAIRYVSAGAATGSSAATQGAASRAPASSGPSSPSASLSSTNQPSPAETEALNTLDLVLDAPDDPPPSSQAQPKPKRPERAPPRLVVVQNEGTPCIEARMINLHRTEPPESNDEYNYWYYTIVLRNRCGYSVVWYAETFVGPSPVPAGYSSSMGGFVYAGYGWPKWALRTLPPNPDYQPREAFTDVPLRASAETTAFGSQEFTNVQPVQIWIQSCNAYADNDKRAMTLFNTGAPLSEDKRFICAPNIVPSILY